MSGTIRRSPSHFFEIPDITMFTEGNTFTGSENTFNFRIKPEEEALRSYLWYGMKCFESSEILDEYDAEKNADGLHALAEHIDLMYEEYREKVASGEVKGRRTYMNGQEKGIITADTGEKE